MRQLVYILILTAITGCEQTSNETDYDETVYYGKWKFHQNGESYTEVWLDKNRAIVGADDDPHVRVFEYTLINDTLELQGIGSFFPNDNFTDQVKYMVIIKNVVDNREDGWVKDLDQLYKDDDGQLQIDTTKLFIEQFRQEFNTRAKRNKKHDNPT